MPSLTAIEETLMLDMATLTKRLAITMSDRGVVYANQGNYDKAISDFTEAIRLDPQFAPAYYNRGTAYLHKGDHAKANADFATARRLKAAQ